jgi:hypothetical protein
MRGPCSSTVFKIKWPLMVLNKVTALILVLGVARVVTVVVANRLSMGVC